MLPIIWIQQYSNTETTGKSSVFSDHASDRHSNTDINVVVNTPPLIDNRSANFPVYFRKCISPITIQFWGSSSGYVYSFAWRYTWCLQCDSKPITTHSCSPFELTLLWVIQWVIGFFIIILLALSYSGSAFLRWQLRSVAVGAPVATGLGSSILTWS